MKSPATYNKQFIKIEQSGVQFPKNERLWVGVL